MNSTTKSYKIHPKQNANLISKLFFGWTFRLFYEGTKRDLEVSDLHEVRNPNKSNVLGDKLEGYWNQELAKNIENPHYTPSLLKALTKTFYKIFLFQHILMFITGCFFRVISPFLLGKLIRCFNETLTDSAYLLAGLLCLNTFLLAIFENHTMKARMLLGMKLRIALCSLMYRKILRLNLSSFSMTSNGQIINLLSNDVTRFDLLFLSIHYFTILPVQVGVIIFLVWGDLQVASLAGILMLIVQCLPVQGYFGRVVAKLRAKIAELTDTRVIIMNEIISGIQVIKMYAWEKPFEAFVNTARIKEVKIIRLSNYVKGFNMASMVFSERTTLFVSVIAYKLLGNYCTPEKVFSMAQFFNVLQNTLAIQYPMAVIQTAEAFVSVKRIQTFLLLDEKDIIDTDEKINTDDLEKGEVFIKNLTTSWISNNPILKNITANIRPGQLCAIVGPVGSGKSSLLNAILSEMTINEGSMRLNGTISYASQEPWLFVGSVRNNILFGLPYDSVRYKRVTSVCSLSKDFKQLPYGDQTLIGDKGASLSGGQKARINLARAVYRSCDIYLLDDPLSAVDTYVGKQLFQEAIEKYLKDKTRILVTHQIQHLENADHIIVLKNGEIEAEGTYKEILSKNIDITQSEEESENEVESNIQRKVSLKRQDTRKSLKDGRQSVDFTDDVLATVEEEVESGKLSWSVYYEYLKASGNICQRILLLAILVLTQLICNANDVWLAYLTNIDENLANNRTTNPVIYNENGTVDDLSYSGYETIENDVDLSGTTAISVYGSLIIATIISTIIRSIYFYLMCTNASINLHNKIFSALLKVPMSFFNKNPIGRIMNRFSKDVGCVDELLPRCLVETFQIFSVMIGILVMVCLVNYFMVIPTILLLILFLIIRTIYLDSAQDVKRLEGTTRSPVFSHASSTLQGLVTIRSCNSEDTLRMEFDQYQDTHTSAWYWTVVCGVVLGLYVDFLCSVFFAVVCFSFILMDAEGMFSSSAVGLALSQAMILTSMMQVGIKQSVEMVCQMTSVERMLQYAKLKTEGPFETPKNVILPRNWPDKGCLKFINVSMKYDNDEPFILKNLYMDINSGEKVGIVGRTGAGKSSLISSLFHLSILDGNIIIDGVDIKTIGLTDLREHISIIPQQPVLFSATMRYNLDPFNQYTDEHLWRALEDVELKDSVFSLDFQIQSGGTNFSIGQRQLICLARAILKKNKILVLDEATANVDQDTDELIQKTIRQKFANCTVLTIAHRLNTIMDSDKVLVMDAGRMVEFDHPHKLLQNTNGIFYKLVTETGPIMTEHLKEMARRSFLNKITNDD